MNSNESAQRPAYNCIYVNGAQGKRIKEKANASVLRSAGMKYSLSCRPALLDVEQNSHLTPLALSIIIAENDI